MSPTDLPFNNPRRGYPEAEILSAILERAHRRMDMMGYPQADRNRACVHSSESVYGVRSGQENNDPANVPLVEALTGSNGLEVR